MCVCEGGGVLVCVDKKNADVGMCTGVGGTSGGVLVVLWTKGTKVFGRTQNQEGEYGKVLCPLSSACILRGFTTPGFQSPRPLPLPEIGALEGLPLHPCLSCLPRGSYRHTSKNVNGVNTCRTLSHTLSHC